MHATLLLGCFLCMALAKDSFVLPLIDWKTSIIVFIYTSTASRLAIDLINANTFPDILPNTDIVLDIREDNLSAAQAITYLIEFAERGETLVVGFPISTIAEPTATVGAVYGVAQMSGSATSDALSNTRKFPYFSRVVVANDGFSRTFQEAISYFYGIRGRGWNEVAVVSTISAYTADLANSFFKYAEQNDIEVIAYQQFLADSGDIDVELNEVKRSGARVILGFIFGDWQHFIEQADSHGLVGDQYVWLVPGTVVGFPFLEPSELTRGALGALFDLPVPGPQLEEFLSFWDAADPRIYPGTDFPPSTLTYQFFDMMLTVAMAIDGFERQGRLNDVISAAEWSEGIRNVTFDGVTGKVAYYPSGDRIGRYALKNYTPERNWITVATLTDDEGFQITQDIIWHSNTTEIPDLDIREPFDYWSCDDKELKTDKTGKTVTLHTPDGSQIDDIDSDYHCDHFIDCQNMSDESVDCAADYIVIFIVFGIVTGILILISFALIIFTIVFGIILHYRRLRQASPTFLVLLLISVIFGYCSIYTWFGKPHPVACGFQPWLLGLSAISMIAALTVKNFRLWRIFRVPQRKIRITDLELFVLWFICMLPAVLVLVIWTIVSTPTAKMVERQGNEHYICATGGFSGEPGGIIFFFIFVAYSAVVLLFGAFISIVTRNIPSAFNESKLLTISIYNLGFLAAVIIPVFLVVNPFNPFIAWILRTCAILYAFTATLFLQFGPMLFGLFILDKGKNVRVFTSHLDFPTRSRSSSTIQANVSSSTPVSG